MFWEWWAADNINEQIMRPLLKKHNVLKALLFTPLIDLTFIPLLSKKIHKAM